MRHALYPPMSGIYGPCTPSVSTVRFGVQNLSIAPAAFMQGFVSFEETHMNFSCFKVNHVNILLTSGSIPVTDKLSV